LCFQGICCLMTSVLANPTKTLKNLGDEGRFISGSIRNDEHKNIKENLLLVFFDSQSYDDDGEKEATITENSLMLSSKNSLAFDDHYYPLTLPERCGCMTTNLCYGDFFRLNPCSIINNQDMMLHTLHSQLPSFTPGMKNYINRSTLDIFLFLISFIIQKYFPNIIGYLMDRMDPISLTTITNSGQG